MVFYTGMFFLLNCSRLVVFVHFNLNMYNNSLTAELRLWLLICFLWGDFSFGWIYDAATTIVKHLSKNVAIVFYLFVLTFYVLFLCEYENRTHTQKDKLHLHDTNLKKSFKTKTHRNAFGSHVYLGGWKRGKRTRYHCKGRRENNVNKQLIAESSSGCQWLILSAESTFLPKIASHFEVLSRKCFARELEMNGNSCGSSL